MKTGVRPQLAHLVAAGFAALLISAALLGFPAHSRGASGGGRPSNNVAVVPGFTPKPYPGFNGVPALPVTSPGVAKYHFSPLAPEGVTTAALSNYDTVILYGIRWSDIPSSGQAAINAFAAKHKVLIWDADATGSQAYSNFIHPFTTLSSGQSYKGKPTDSVVYFAKNVDFLASSNPASPFYLDPTQLVHDRDELNDMNAIKTGTANWRPSILAANHGNPRGAWPIAWSYGVIGDHTGMTIYSGLDADAFPTQDKMNNDKKELALELAAPVRSTPDPSCASKCTLPTVSMGLPFTTCGFSSMPHHWAHGRVPVVVETSLAESITAQVLTGSGRVLASGNELTGNQVPLVIPTGKLPANRSSQLQARVLVYGAPACTNRFQVIKSKSRPGLLLLATSLGTRHLLTLRVNHTSYMKVIARHLHWRTNRVSAHKIVQFSLAASVRKATLVIHDQAGHTLKRSLIWH